MTETVRRPPHTMDQYASGMHAARARFAADPALAMLLHGEMEPATLERFLIQFSALGVGMTEPVVSWIRRAGKRCEAVGLAELGRALRSHAEHEAGHHLMMVRDTHSLVDWWNVRRTPRLDADRLLAQPATPGVLRYRAVHEENIAGSVPFAQVAIQYEIERLPVEYGPPLIEQWVRILGPAILERLSFLQEHIRLDVGHTRYNEKHLARLLRDHPEYLPALVEAGGSILDAYAAFLSDCLRLARDPTGTGATESPVTGGRDEQKGAINGEPTNRTKRGRSPNVALARSPTRTG